MCREIADNTADSQTKGDLAKGKGPLRRRAALSGLLGDRLHDVGVTNVGDRQHRGAEQLSARSAEGDVIAAVVVHSSLRKHCIVLNLRLAQRRAVVGDEDELGCRAHERQAKAGRVR